MTVSCSNLRRAFTLTCSVHFHIHVLFYSLHFTIEGERLQESEGDDLALAVATAGREQQESD